MGQEHAEGDGREQQRINASRHDVGAVDTKPPRPLTKDTVDEFYPDGVEQCDEETVRGMPMP